MRLLMTDRVRGQEFDRVQVSGTQTYSRKFCTQNAGQPYHYTGPTVQVPYGRYVYMADDSSSRPVYKRNYPRDLLLGRVDVYMNVAAKPFTTRANDNSAWVVNTWEFPFDPAQLVSSHSDVAVGDFLDFGLEFVDGVNEALETDVSLANFIYEAREITSLVPRFRSLQSFPASKANLRHGVVPPSWGATQTTFAAKFAAAAKDIRDFILGYSFGIAPTLGNVVYQNCQLLVREGDAFKIARLLSSVDDKMAELRAKLGQVEHVRSKREVNDGLFHLDPRNHYVGDGWGHRFRLVPVSRRITYRASAKRQMLLDLSDEWDFTMRTLMSITGVTKLGDILWECIPYSFVADYFSNIGSIFHVLNLDPFSNGRVLVHDLSYSITEEAWYTFQVYSRVYDRDYSHACSAQYPMVYEDPASLGSVRVLSKRRYSGWPFSEIDYLSFKTPTAKQMLLLGCLIF